MDSTDSASRAPLKSRAMRGVLAIVLGSAGAQALTAAATPVLSRLYTPGQFGTFSVSMSIIITLGAIGACRYEAAVPIPARREDALIVVQIGQMCILAISITGLVITMLWPRQIADLLNIPAASGVLWLIPTSAAILSGYQLLTQLAIRDRRYHATARRSLYAGATVAAVQLLLGFSGAGVGGLLVGYGAGQLAGLVAMAVGAGASSMWSRERRVPWKCIRGTARRFRRFPLYSAPSALFNAMSLQLPVVLIALLYGAHESGYLGMTQRALGLPIALIGVAVGQVYLGELSNAMTRDISRARDMFIKTSRTLLVVGLAVAIPIFFLGPSAFARILGNEWAQSGQFAKALSVSLAAQLLASPLSSTLTLFERQRLLFVLDTSRLVLTSLTLVLLAKSGFGPLVAIWGLSLSGFLTYIAYWYACSRVVRSTLVGRHLAVG